MKKDLSKEMFFAVDLSAPKYVTLRIENVILATTYLSFSQFYRFYRLYRLYRLYSFCRFV